MFILNLSSFYNTYKCIVTFLPKENKIYARICSCVCVCEFGILYFTNTILSISRNEGILNLNRSVAHTHVLQTILYAPRLARSHVNRIRRCNVRESAIRGFPHTFRFTSHVVHRNSIRVYQQLRSRLQQRANERENNDTAYKRGIIFKSTSAALIILGTGYWFVIFRIRCV